MARAPVFEVMDFHQTVGKEGTPVTLKRLQGVVRVPSASTPRVRVSTGVIATAPFSSTPSGNEASSNALAVVTLSPTKPCQGELTIIMLDRSGCETEISVMILARYTFAFSTDPLQGVSKVVWAGRSAVAVMSSVGEVVCLRSGLREPCMTRDLGEHDIYSDCSEDDGESGGEMLLCNSKHAIDMCALSMECHIVLVTTDHIKTECCVWALSGGVPTTTGQFRELSIGGFQHIAGVSCSCDGPAFLLGCKLGSVVLFEWASPELKPTAVRSFLMGLTVFYVAIATDVCSSIAGPNGKEKRVVRFCVLSTAVAENKAEKGVVSLKSADGIPFQVVETANNADPPRYSSTLPSWNIFCRDGFERTQGVSSILSVTQPQLSATTTTPQVLAITVTQNRPFASGGQTPARDENGGNGALRSVLEVDCQIFSATSPECKDALKVFPGDVTMVTTMRYPVAADTRGLGEFCLFDGKQAIVFGLCEDYTIEPRACVSAAHHSGLLAGVAWPSVASRVLLLLSGKPFDDRQSRHGVDSGAVLREEAERTTTQAVGELVLIATKPQPWRRSGSAGLDEERLVEAVRTAVRRENEKMVLRLEERLLAIERRIDLLLGEKGRS